MPKLFELAVRNLAAATMDELQRAVFKATTDERTPPKEKHVATILRLAASGESAEHVDEALMKRLLFTPLGYPDGTAPLWGSTRFPAGIARRLGAMRVATEAETPEQEVSV